MSDDRTLALRSQTPPDVAEMAGLIKAMLPNGKNLTDQEAIAGAMYGKAHGLDPFKQEYYIVPGRGIFPGYRGEMRMQEAREYYTQTRPLRSDEAAEHEIQPGDTARIVELFQPDLMRQMRTLGITYQPILGLGIVRKAEKQSTPPTGRSWAWKAEQRALKDAMRHMQGGADILDETVDMRLADAEDRAESVLAEVRDLPPAAQQAQFTATVNAMRGDPEHDPFDDNPPGMNGDLFHADTVDAEFERIPTAQQERAATPPVAAPAKPKTAVIKCKDFFDLATVFATQHPAWQNGNGDADSGHICASIAKLGFAEITQANIVEVFRKLEAHALSKEFDSAIAEK